MEMVDYKMKYNTYIFSETGLEWELLDKHTFHKPNFTLKLFNSYKFIQGTVVTTINKSLMLSFSKYTICICIF